VRWTLHPIQTDTGPLSSGIRGISFADAEHGTLIAGQSRILQTTDGGQTWTEGQSVSDRVLNGVVAIDPTTSVAVGERGTILASRPASR
jgi:photosystem II stability/assembly factor-like uncharacterized protein